MLADMQATDEEIGESIEEVTEVVVIEGWVSKPLEGVTGVEVEEKVLVGKVLVLSTEIRGELEEELEEELVAALRAAWNLAAL